MTKATQRRDLSPGRSASEAGALASKWSCLCEWARDGQHCPSPRAGQHADRVTGGHGDLQRVLGRVPPGHPCVAFTHRLDHRTCSGDPGGSPVKASPSHPARVLEDHSLREQAATSPSRNGQGPGAQSPVARQLPRQPHRAGHRRHWPPIGWGCASAVSVPSEVLAPRVHVPGKRESLRHTEGSPDGL